MDLESKLNELDQQLKSRLIHLSLRPLACFKAIYGSVLEPRKREELFEPINLWYWKTYGERVRWDGVVATFPVLVRGEMFSSDANVLDTRDEVNYKSAIVDLPEELAQQLGDDDFRLISERMQQANLAWRHLYNLSIDTSMLQPQAEVLVDRAIHDLKNAGATLTKQHDLNTGLVQAHEGAEKFIKAGLIYGGFKGDVEKFKHNLSKAYTALANLEHRYSALPETTAALAQLVPNMQLRYGPPTATVEEATSGYQSALYICGILARIWVLDQQRGTKESSFRETFFYETPIGSYAYCKSVQNDSVTLLCFRPVHNRNVLYEMNLQQRESALYLQVKEDQRLRHELTWYVRNCRRPVPPAESNLSIVKGKEGSFASSVMKFRVGKNGMK